MNKYKINEIWKGAQTEVHISVLCNMLLKYIEDNKLKKNFCKYFLEEIKKVNNPLERHYM
jgi:hypothetical protein